MASLCGGASFLVMACGVSSCRSGSSYFGHSLLLLSLPRQFVHRPPSWKWRPSAWCLLVGFIVYFVLIVTETISTLLCGGPSLGSQERF